MKPNRAPGGLRAGLPQEDLAGALHEVSNALTVVLGWLDEIRSASATEAVHEAAAVAYTHARLGHAIARRAIGADVEEAGVPRSAIRLAQEAALGVSREAARRKVAVAVGDILGADVLLRAAPGALQVLVNLLLNAIAFSPEGSTIHLRVRGDGERASFTVRDHGAGIAVDRVESLFSSPASTRVGGAGIGLWHARSLAVAHGGDLRLTDTGPDGACFELRWPAGDPPSGTIHRTAVSLNGLRVVALEDDAAVCSLIELGLSARGAEVAAVGTLAELEVLLSRGVFDVALLDLSPLGSEPTRTLRRLGELAPRTSVVVISGSAAPDVDPAAVDAWVRKPFEIAELAEAIERLRTSS